MPFAACRNAGQAILPCSRLSEVAEKSQSHSWPPMNTDERRLKTIALSAFISVDRRLNLPLPDFFSSLFQAALEFLHFQPSSKPTGSASGLAGSAGGLAAGVLLVVCGKQNGEYALDCGAANPGCRRPPPFRRLSPAWMTVHLFLGRRSRKVWLAGTLGFDPRRKSITCSSARDALASWPLGLAEQHLQIPRS
jgi:hypothetical protein